MSQYSDYFDRQTPLWRCTKSFWGWSPREDTVVGSFPWPPVPPAAWWPWALVGSSSGATPEQKGGKLPPCPTPNPPLPPRPSPPLHLPELQYSTGGSRNCRRPRLTRRPFSGRPDARGSGPPLWRNRLVGGAGLDPLRPASMTARGQWQVFLRQQENDAGTYSLALAPNHLPPACVVAEPRESTTFGVQRFLPPRTAMTATATA